jgi:hypothetical protein
MRRIRRFRVVLNVARWPTRSSDWRQAVVPAATAASLNEIHVRRGRIQIDPAHDSRPELSATITILRADGANSPAADVQHRVAEVTGRLRSIGAQERQWQEGLRRSDGFSMRFAGLGAFDDGGSAQSLPRRRVRLWPCQLDRVRTSCQILRT